MQTVTITYGGETVAMQWDAAHASAPILINGESTPYQTADARHRTSEAVRLVAHQVWGPVYETEQDAREDGREPGDQTTIWDDLEYRTET